MAGIAGIAATPQQHIDINAMLNKIAHRGRQNTKLIMGAGITLGVVWSDADEINPPPFFDRQAVWDGDCPRQFDPQTLVQTHGHFALAAINKQDIFLARDPLGVRPLYYGKTSAGCLCFASEVKALLDLTESVDEFPPGHWTDGSLTFKAFYEPELAPPYPWDARTFAGELRLRLEQSVGCRIHGDIIGCWLSGGLDSSVLAALARPHVKQLHTFAGGLPGAPDLEYAQMMADHLKTEHHEVIVSLVGLLNVLPSVIYHLESFDALLVRSTLLNYLVAEAASRFVGSAFSGEGGDELFGGYDYLKDIPESSLAAELLEITRRLHNTALQRVDRSAGAHGLNIQVPFLDLDVVELALRIPPGDKIKRAEKTVEKWILRQAVADLLPEEVLWRGKAKFWQGSGVGELLARHADEKIQDAEFQRERALPNGWRLNTKEELFYYRIFKDHFGELEQLDWMGRTKGSPIQ